MRPDDPRVPGLIQQFEHIGHDLFCKNPDLISAGIGYRCYSLGSGAAPAARHDPSRLCIYLSFRDGGVTATHGGNTIDAGQAFPGFPADLPVQYEYRYPAVYEPNGPAPPAGPSGGLDCALATLPDGAGTSILGLGVAPSEGTPPSIGAKLVKSGSGSGLTFGRVVRKGLVKMNFGGTYDCVVIECVEIDSDPDVYSGKVEICKPGDSGAVWLHYEVTDPKKFQQQVADLPPYLADPEALNFDHRDPLGSFRATSVAALHFGEDNALMERALAVPIDRVLHRLHVGLKPDWHRPAPAPPAPAENTRR